MLSDVDNEYRAEKVESGEGGGMVSDQDFTHARRKNLENSENEN